MKLQKKVAQMMAAVSLKLAKDASGNAYLKCFLLGCLSISLLSGCYRSADKNLSYEEAVESESIAEKVEKDPVTPPENPDNVTTRTRYITVDGVITEVEYEFTPSYISSEQIYSMGTQLTHEGFEIKFNDVQFTKDTANLAGIYYTKNDLPETILENGVLREDYSFVILDLSITNSGDTESEFYLNDFGLAAVRDDMVLLESFPLISESETYDFKSSHIFGANVQQFGGKQKMRYVFSPNESLNVKIAAIVNNNGFDFNLYISPGGEVMGRNAKSLKLIEIYTKE